MLPDWLKREEEIYNRYKDLKNVNESIRTGIDDIRKIYYEYLNGNNFTGPYSIHDRGRNLNIPSGIESTENLRPVSIVISNWERYYYIPLILEMYNNQDYPHNLIEILIIDDDSKDKNVLLNTIKEHVKLYPDLKIRFIQNYINKCQNPAKRRNIGIRHSSYDIVIVNESDTIPLGRYFLRGICYAHNKFERMSCIGISIAFSVNNYVDNLLKIFDDHSVVTFRLDHDYIMSFNKELVSKIRGFDEKTVGYGGLEGNICYRYDQIGGRVFLNTSIYSAALPNFPKPLPSDITNIVPASYGWQNTIVINDDNWGISEKMEEINLY